MNQEKIRSSISGVPSDFNQFNDNGLVEKVSILEMQNRQLENTISDLRMALKKREVSLRAVVARSSLRDDNYAAVKDNLVGLCVVFFLIVAIALMYVFYVNYINIASTSPV